MILLFVTGFFLIPNISFAQNNEDSVVKVIDEIEADSTNKISSYSIEENEIEKNIKEVIFLDARLDTANFSERLSVNDTIAKMKRQDIYQYHPKNEEAKKEEKKTSNNKPFFSEGFLKFIFWFITLGFLVVVIVMYAMDGNLNLFAKRSKKVQILNIDEDVFKQNIFDLKYSILIQQAIESADFNKAVRLGFLRILTLLHHQKLISYSIEKTNFDYQFQLMHSKHYQDFLLTSNYYDYAWYSGNVINTNQYNKIIISYQKFEQKLN